MIVVLRLGHRKDRDKRISTHCGLVARAFGADKIIYSGEKDESLLESIKDVIRRWGGPFEVEYRKDWRNVIKEFPGIKVHLTMYGLPIQDIIKEIRGKDVLVIIGAEKVPGEVYGMVDYNVAVTNQPHSEVAALAIFLHEYFQGKELNKTWKGEIYIVPSEKGKIVKKRKDQNNCDGCQRPPC